MAQRDEPFKRPGDDRYSIRWRDPKTGKRPSASGFKTKAAARAHRDREVGYADHPASLNETVERFMRSYAWKSEGRKTSVEYALAKLTPTFGELPIESITLLELQEWRQGLGTAQTQWHATQAAKQLFKWAEKARLISRNEAAHLSNPTPAASEVKPFRAGEVELAATELGKTYGRIPRFVEETGVRVGEWLALEWGDIDRSDPKAPFVRIERALKPNMKVGPPKTRASRRKIGLTPRALEAIGDPAALPRALVFPGTGGGYLKIRNWRRDHWNPALIAAGFVDDDGKADRPPTALRHTYAMNRLRDGLPTFTVARRMGTSVQMIEKTYGHHAEDALEWELEVQTGRHTDAEAL